MQNKTFTNAFQPDSDLSKVSPLPPTIKVSAQAVLEISQTPLVMSQRAPVLNNYAYMDTNNQDWAQSELKSFM